MSGIVIAVSVLLSVFSTAVMSYITMATPIGPWIATTLVLLAMLIYKLLGQCGVLTEKIVLSTCAGSIGGIVATAFGFSFPTLYFLDQPLFNSWMASPFYFCAVLSSLAFVAGWFGIWIANVVEHRFIVQEQLAFPIGQLVYKMITAQNQVRKAWELMVGFVGTAVFCFFQDGLFGFKGFISKSITLSKSFTVSIFTIPTIPFDIFPMLWAIGFVTGHVIALPLAAGAIASILVVSPINHVFFPALTNMEFILAFCSGMVLTGAVMSLLDMPKQLFKFGKAMVGSIGKSATSTDNIDQAGTSFMQDALSKYFLKEAVPLLLCLVIFLTYFEFSLLAQIYLIAFTFVCAYQIANIAGKIGLAYLGRFATFVMVPAMFLFTITYTQIVFIATFVEICGGVATDILFGRKIAYLSNLSVRTMKKFQYLGLVVSSLSIGMVFWLLINHFGLGSPDLFAQRAQTRQLLIAVKSFDYYVLIIGFVFGYLLKRINLNPALVLGGLLMPLNISLGLIIGGLCTMLVKNKEEWYPFWSGVFASNSVWMLIRAIV